LSLVQGREEWLALTIAGFAALFVVTRLATA
jgi:hypothetical protein